MVLEWSLKKGGNMNCNKSNQKKNNVPFISHSSVIEKYSQISYLQVNEQDWCLTDKFQVVARVSES